jgi:cytochrome c556
MRTVSWVALLVAAVGATAFVTSRIGHATPASPAAVADAAPVGTIKDVMKGIVDPNADEIWEAVSTDSTEKGVIEHSPKTDEDWSKVEGHALTLAEAAELLLNPRRPVARPEQATTTSQPGAPELNPKQIGEKIESNRAEWARHAKDLQAAALKAIDAARAHDKDALLNVGETIDNACENCHLVYWYPDQQVPKL